MKPISLPALIRLMRPHQWLKNVFVLAGLVFSQSWRDPSVLERVLIAFAAFCCVSSMVYILNDWHDRAADAQHPTKKSRPLASGAVPVPQGIALAALLLAGGIWLARDSRALLFLLGWYVLLNMAYSWRLKRVPVVDVSIIASGFMLRLMAGTWAVGIPPSRWLLLTGLFVALFLGFSKRKAESFHAAGSQRTVLALYPPALLDTFIGVTLTATLTTYSLYATSPETQLQHGETLLYTVPVVIFGMLRYAYEVHKGKGEDVARDLLRDPWILAAGICWVAIFASRWL
ncbi:MAG: decaprenyl-phosphate phosphoribosyltransferase [Polaromonas sp.]|uniref:decaprenyl-phosphate phosphoribosyltransferase n=1 Tax=Polaromonas sp. TaxID=1869339 RepID=UPI0025FF5DC4|nr:decaprenyl-phosphate phosphoribosyltransferase [Polaromonas sp.]MBI2728127.1 decaprenyl-phosphate phosphoribosyltransferase [Polaromonas sp.]